MIEGFCWFGRAEAGEVDAVREGLDGLGRAAFLGGEVADGELGGHGGVFGAGEESGVVFADDGV